MPRNCFQYSKHPSPCLKLSSSSGIPKTCYWERKGGFFWFCMGVVVVMIIIRDGSCKTQYGCDALRNFWQTSSDISKSLNQIRLYIAERSLFAPVYTLIICTTQPKLTSSITTLSSYIFQILVFHLTYVVLSFWKTHVHSLETLVLFRFRVSSSDTCSCKQDNGWTMETWQH